MKDKNRRVFMREGMEIDRMIMKRSLRVTTVVEVK
jgi:hypothetical protein